MRECLSLLAAYLQVYNFHKRVTLVVVLQRLRRRVGLKIEDGVVVVAGRLVVVLADIVMQVPARGFVPREQGVIRVLDHVDLVAVGRHADFCHIDLVELVRELREFHRRDNRAPGEQQGRRPQDCLDHRLDRLDPRVWTNNN